MRSLAGPACLAAAFAVAATPAVAQGRVSDMLADCQFEAAKRLGGDVADTTVTYENQRVDGTHAVNGTIGLAGRTARFQCSFAADRVTLVAFWSDAGPAQRPPHGGATSAGSHTVRFAAGATNTTATGRLGSEEAATYVLGARDGQFLTVSLRPDNRDTYMIVYVPGGDILYESSQAGNEYYGQLYRTGDHRVEVFYKGEPGTIGNYDVYFEIR